VTESFAFYQECKAKLQNPNLSPQEIAHWAKACNDAWLEHKKQEQLEQNSMVMKQLRDLYGVTQ
jgi:hypothetical protein